MVYTRGHTMDEETHTKNVGDNIVDAHSIPTM